MIKLQKDKNLPQTGVVDSKTLQALESESESGKTTKEQSIIAVQRLFPSVDLLDPTKLRSRKLHDGMAEALLIAEWGRRQWMKN